MVLDYQYVNRGTITKHKPEGKAYHPCWHATIPSPGNIRKIVKPARMYWIYRNYPNCIFCRISSSNSE